MAVPRKAALRPSPRTARCESGRGPRAYVIRYTFAMEATRPTTPPGCRPRRRDRSPTRASCPRSAGRRRPAAISRCAWTTQHVAITVSGRDKGRLTEADIMVVDLDGQPGRHDQKSVGGDAAAHAAVQALPRRRLRAAHPFAGADAWPRACTPALATSTSKATNCSRPSRQRPPTRASDRRAGASPTPRTCPRWPRRSTACSTGSRMWGYLIDGHGLYAWGRDMAEARRHLEAFEFLLGCELELRKLHR